MNSMEKLIAVNGNTEGIIGKFFYYSTSKILIDKEKFQEIGRAFGLPKFKPAKESKAGAYRNATSAVKDRVVVKDAAGEHIYRVYFRDNKKEDEHRIFRELVKETLGARTNDFAKLANVIFDKRTETVYTEDEAIDTDVDAAAYCRKAERLFSVFCDCYSTDQVESVILDQLERMRANKISIHGNLYFVPNPFLPQLCLLEDYVEAIGKENLNDGVVISNSMFVVDDERQREKMTEEFFINYKRDVELYQKRIQSFIDNGCDSKAVIERWVRKIGALREKKQTYEEILHRRLDALNSETAMLEMQAEELRVRARTNENQTPLAA